MSDSDEYVPAYDRVVAEQWVRAPWTRSEREEELLNNEPVEHVSLKVILHLLLRACEFFYYVASFISGTSAC